MTNHERGLRRWLLRFAPDANVNTPERQKWHGGVQQQGQQHEQQQGEGVAEISRSGNNKINSLCHLADVDAYKFVRSDPQLEIRVADHGVMLPGVNLVCGTDDKKPLLCATDAELFIERNVRAIPKIDSSCRLREGAGGEGIINVLPLMDRRIEIRLQPASWTREPVESGNFPPDHLLVLVHGILASPTDWKYVEGELKAQLGNKYLIYASAVNSYLSTLNGIDSAGQRLAEEIGFIVKRTPSLKRISFLGHSLGGLFARYAIASLYASPAGKQPQTVNGPPDEELESSGERESRNGGQKPTIAGLEPINFLTLASPHLGVRGRQQLPFLLGLPVLEKLAAPLAPFFVGSTGRQLFLTDGKPSDPPLLLRMATNCDEGQFISALAAFKVRILYANVSYDHMVGWRTASIRREGELTKPPRQSLPGYKHVVNVVDYPPVESCRPHYEEGTAKAKAAIQRSPTRNKKAAAYHDILEEEIIRGLQQVGWRKVDISFHAALWPFLAHNNIHVKQEWLHHEGAGVVRHVTDTLKETDQKQLLHSRL